MSKGNYTHIKFLEPEILAMKESGKTKQKIAEHHGLIKEPRTLIDNYIHFYSRQRIPLKTEVAPLTLRHFP